MTSLNLESLDEIGKTIRVWRESAGLSQSALARRLRTSQSAVSRWEHGHDEPRLSTIAAILAECDLAGELHVGPGVDRAQIRQQLAMTPQQRIESTTGVARLLATARRVR